MNVASVGPETCVGRGATRRLVEARFSRPVSAAERAELETHLSSCAACAERYRRLQLADRVLALGPERAHLEPSPQEIERIARDLGLEEGAAPASWLARLGLGGAGERAFSVLAGAAAAASVAGLVIFASMRSGDELVARGGERPLSFAAYVIGEGSSVRLLSAERPAGAKEHLKLRASGPGVHGLLDVGLVVVLESGAVERFDLSAPEDDSGGDVVSVPGAIELGALPPGEHWAYAVGLAGQVSAEELDRAAKDVPSAEEFARRLGDKALGVDRFRLVRGDPAR